jgi:hypothetical protein
MLRMGFTGTRHGMTNEQEQEFKKLIMAKDFEEFHHGMCNGSDEQAHHIVEEEKQNVKIIGHPPKFTGSLASLPCYFLMKADTYLIRNRNIVDATDILVATPDTKERPRSGTWSTVRYARKKQKKIYIIHKNGRVTVEK